MWRAVDLQGRRTTLSLGDLVSILGQHVGRVTSKEIIGYLF
jgi:hypothetical protein